MAIDVRPATVFDDAATIVGPKRPDANVCWCLSYRLPSKENVSLRGPARGEKVAALMEQGPIGVLAYDGDDVVGWAAVARRADTTFARNRTIPHVDDLDVWSVWCIRVRPGHRRQGISHSLLAGAVEFARSRGAPAIESYPGCLRVGAGRDAGRFNVVRLWAEGEGGGSSCTAGPPARVSGDLPLTTCASAAGDHAPARTNQSSAASPGDAAPERGPGPLRPVGCRRGLGGRRHLIYPSPARPNKLLPCERRPILVFPPAPDQAPLQVQHDYPVIVLPAPIRVLAKSDLLDGVKGDRVPQHPICPGRGDRGRKELPERGASAVELTIRRLQIHRRFREAGSRQLGAVTVPPRGDTIEHRTKRRGSEWLGSCDPTADGDLVVGRVGERQDHWDDQAEGECSTHRSPGLGWLVRSAAAGQSRQYGPYLGGVLIDVRIGIQAHRIVTEQERARALEESLVLSF